MRGLRRGAKLGTGGIGPPEEQPMIAVRVSLVAGLLLSLGLTAMAAAGFH